MLEKDERLKDSMGRGGRRYFFHLHNNQTPPVNSPLLCLCCLIGLNQISGAANLASLDDMSIVFHINGVILMMEGYNIYTTES